MRANAWIIRNVVAVVGLVAVSAPARAQDGPLDPRWQPWLGCWQPVQTRNGHTDIDAPRVCVIPVAGTSAVEFLTVAGETVRSRERVEATAEPRALTVENCTGTERAAWSDEAMRLFRSSELECPNVPPRHGTSLSAIAMNGDWLEVQSVSARRGTAVRVMRYRAVAALDFPTDEIRDALRDLAVAGSAARTAAAAELRDADVIEASRAVDSAVVEAWLSENGQGFDISGRSIRQLARSGVASRVIDLMVALSYPRTFGIALARGDTAQRDPSAAPNYWTIMSGGFPATYYSGYGGCGYDPFFYSQSWYSTGYGCPGSAYNYGYGYGYTNWYGAYRPVLIVVGGGEGSGSGTAAHGAVVKGTGYSAGRGVSGSRVARPSDGASGGRTFGSVTGGSPQPGVGGSGDGGGSAGSGSTGGSSTGSGESRTAKPRP